MPTIRGGFFVVLEGCDGAGTTTQQEKLATRLRAQGEAVTCLAQPSSGETATAAGKLIRDMLEHRVPMMNDVLATQMLYVADRLELCAGIIEPSLGDGYIVISDRHELSTIVYGAALAPRYRCTARGCGWTSDGPIAHPNFATVTGQTADWHDCGAPGSKIEINTAYVGRVLLDANQAATRADLTIVVSVRPEVAAARRRARGGVVESFDGDALQARVCELYDTPRALFHGVDTNRFEDLVYVDGNGAEGMVHQAIWDCVTDRIRRRRAWKNLERTPA